MRKQTHKPQDDDVEKWWNGALNQSCGVAWHLTPSPLQVDQSCAFYMLQNPGNRIPHIWIIKDIMHCGKMWKIQYYSSIYAIHFLLSFNQTFLISPYAFSAASRASWSSFTFRFPFTDEASDANLYHETVTEHLMCMSSLTGMSHNMHLRYLRTAPLQQSWNFLLANISFPALVYQFVCPANSKDVIHQFNRGLQPR